jgi:hypothetical protein
MNIKITKVTPNHKFYMRYNGEIVACRITEIAISVPSVRDTRYATDFVAYTDLQLANGMRLNHTTLSNCNLYTTPQDCYEKANKVTFTLSNEDLIESLVMECGCTPSILKDRLVVWTYNRYGMYAGLDNIETFYPFRKSLVIATGNKWYNTKQECIESNMPRIVEFEDDVKVMDIVEQRPRKTIRVLIEVY